MDSGKHCAPLEKALHHDVEIEENKSVIHALGVKMIGLIFDMSSTSP
jgi:hypothetical protein